MTSALNFTLKIKQTPEVLERLKGIKTSFATRIQPLVDAALKKSEIVHFARVLVIDDLYIQVITEFDGEESVYAEFFRKELLPLFAAVFSLTENPPSEQDIQNPDKFFKFTSAANLRALGTDGLEHDKPEEDRGYFFQGYPGVLVKDIHQKIG